MTLEEAKRNNSFDKYLEELTEYIEFLRYRNSCIIFADCEE